MANLKGRIRRLERWQHQPPVSEEISPLEYEELQKEIEDWRSSGINTEEELLSFIEKYLGLHIPRKTICPDHDAPAQYLIDTYFSRVLNCICWANRGGSKTLLGAVNTFLNSTFRAECSTRILAGSYDQALRMYDHIKGEGDGVGLVRAGFHHLIKGKMQMHKTKYINNSSIQILAATHKQVRGAHPQHLKLDEIDEVDSRIYEAALSIPMSKEGIEASIHIFSTMHRAYGLMQQVVEEAPIRGYRLYKWCILDVLEKCPGENCPECDLFPECQGRAVNADGFYKISDAITKKRQVSEATWQSEYLCRQPSQEGLIYKAFDLAVHVVSDPFEDELSEEECK